MNWAAPEINANNMSLTLLSETKFHNVMKFVLTQQPLKSLHLLMESGDVVFTGLMIC